MLQAQRSSRAKTPATSASHAFANLHYKHGPPRNLPFPALHLLVVPPTHHTFPPSPPPRDLREVLWARRGRGLCLFACRNAADTLPRAPRGGLEPSRWPGASGAGLDQVTATKCAHPTSGKEQIPETAGSSDQPHRWMIVEGDEGTSGVGLLRSPSIAEIHLELSPLELTISLGGIFCGIFRSVPTCATGAM